MTYNALQWRKQDPHTAQTHLQTQPKQPKEPLYTVSGRLKPCGMRHRMTRVPCSGMISIEKGVLYPVSGRLQKQQTRHQDNKAYR